MTMFRRSADGFSASFTDAEAQVLRQCVAEFAELLSEGVDRDDPAIERLFPDIYPEDPEAEADLRQFTEDELLTAKLDQARTVLTDLIEAGGDVELDEEGADAWLRALTDVRLALGTRLGIADDTDIEAELDAAVGRNPTSPRVGQLSVYAYLSLLQESLVLALVNRTR